MLFLDFSEGAAEVGVAGMDVDIGELGGEFLCYCCRFGVGFGDVCPVFECDRLVRGDFDSIAIQGADHIPESFEVGPVGDGGDVGSPS